MSTIVDQKAYLQKYLGGPSGDKKKKKKKVVKGKGFKIIDDDIDLSKLRPLEGDELDIYDEGEDAPQVAGIVDDRPEHVKKQEQFSSSSKWKIVNQDDGFNSKLQIEEIVRDVKETEKENELIFGKMYSDSEDEKNKDSDASPPRKSSKNKKHNSDSDFSPPRRGRENSRKDSPKKRNNDSDLSPPRKPETKNPGRVKKPSRWDTETNTSSKIRRSDSSDQSPPRKTQRNASPKERRENESKNHKRFDTSPQRSKRDDSKFHRQETVSPPRRRKSPERSQSGKNRQKYEPSKQDKRKMASSDSDLSPPRKSKRISPQNNSSYKRRDDSNTSNRDKRHEDKSHRKTQRHESDSDLSQPRRNKDKPSDRKVRKRNNSDSDLSPPRKDKKDRHRDSPPPTHKKMDKTLEGKKAGLQDARQLRQENEDFRQREEEVFKKMTDDVSGKNAKVVSRKGKRDNSEERKKIQEKLARQKEIDEKYKKWSKGLKQIEAQEERLQDYMHESSKPLARHKDDMDSENRLKQIERDGDPMLKYIQDRKREKGEMAPERPQYKGNFPPNRFNLRPGYRWDGVDRSNGYEKKYFDQQSKRKAQEEEAYKWSTEDL